MEFSRLLYTAVVIVVSPLLPFRLWWRGRREPGYRTAIAERFGRYAKPDPPVQPLFWLHAVSVGETRAAVPIVDRLQRAYPEARVLLTHMTATGRETGRALFGDRVTQCWLPYDLPFAMRRFFAHFVPRAGLLMETELWPNLIAEASRTGVPLFLINARLSERSARGYLRIAPLVRAMLARLTGIAAQSPADATRLVALGAKAPIVTGNLKFDVRIPAETPAIAAALKGRIGGERRVWIAASTREGEEALILDALSRRPLAANALLVLVPRHPQRFDAVATLLEARGIRYVRRSADSAVPDDVAVLLGDSMGEMAAYLTVAELAFVGGSLLPLGGQNLIEALALGRPVLMGPHMFNFAEAANGAHEAGAALEVADADALVTSVAALLDDSATRGRMSDAARALYAAHAGAADRTWTWLEPQLNPKARD